MKDFIKKVGIAICATLITLPITIMVTVIIKDVSIDVGIWTERLFPAVPILLYNVVVAILSLTILIALIWAIFISIRACWRFLTDEEVRLRFVDEFNLWPNRKLDVVGVVSLVISVASMLTLLVFARVYTSSDNFVPNDPDTTTYAVASAFLVPMACILPFFGIAMWETVRSFVQEFRAENTKGRGIMVAFVAFMIFVYLFMMLGQSMGWDQ